MRDARFAMKKAVAFGFVLCLATFIAGAVRGAAAFVGAEKPLRVDETDLMHRRAGDVNVFAGRVTSGLCRMCSCRVNFSHGVMVLVSMRFVRNHGPLVAEASTV